MVRGRPEADRPPFSATDGARTAFEQRCGPSGTSAFRSRIVPFLQLARSDRQGAAQLGAKVGLMIARGLAVSPWLRGVSGVPLVGRGVRLRNPQYITLGRRFVIEDYAEVQGISVFGIQFGDGVSVGAGTLVRPSGYYSSDIGEGLAVGNRSSIGPSCYIGCSGMISIGCDVMLAPGVRLFAEDHLFRGQGTIKSQGVQRAPIVIEDDCWLASGTTVTSGVVIGAGSVIAAGSVVTKDVAPRSIMAGAPARQIGSR